MQAERFRIFLASPSGLDDYRRAARDQFGQIRVDVASRCGIDLDAIGWEDIPPGFGRPQSIINPKLDACNVLVGILGKELGTPTGVAASGFVEEYERMAARARAGEDVEIWMYLLELPAEALADPGEKLKAVLEFRDRLLGDALIKQVRSVDDFRGQLYRDLNSLVLDANDRRQQRSESAATATANDDRQTPKQDHSDEAGRQLRELLSGAAAEAPLPPQSFRDGRFSLTRLALWISTWEGWAFTSETFDVHPLNRLYTMRDSAVLSEQEKRHVLRSLCAHQSVAPGWALTRYSDDSAAAALVSLALSDRKEDVRIGAFELLDAQLLDRWLATDVDSDRKSLFNAMLSEVDDLSDAARDAMIDFVSRCGGGEAYDFLGVLAERDGTRPRARQALIRLHAIDDVAGAIVAAAKTDFELDDETVATLRTAAANATTAQLEPLANAQSEALRTVAIDLLAARGGDAVELLGARLDDPSDAVALAAFLALSEIAGTESLCAAASVRLQARETLRLDDDLRRAQDRLLDTAVLIESLNWIELWSASAYRVLAEERWDQFSAVVRRDLTDSFRAFADESRVRYTRRLGPAVMAAIAIGDSRIATVSGDVVTPVDPRAVERLRGFIAGSDLNDHLFARAALTGIARNGEADDATLVRPWLESEDARSREAAALALARVGTNDDVTKLLGLSRPYGGDLYARTALSLSEAPATTAIELLDSSNSASALVGARYLFQHAADISVATLDLLLRHTIDDVRRVGVACALKRYNARDLDDLLTRYTSARTYYYNVTVLLDRVLFAPPSLRDKTRSELRVFAEDDQPRHEPRNSGSHLAAQLWARLKVAGAR